MEGSSFNSLVIKALLTEIQSEAARWSAISHITLVTTVGNTKKNVGGKVALRKFTMLLIQIKQSI